MLRLACLLHVLAVAAAPHAQEEPARRARVHRLPDVAPKRQCARREEQRGVRAEAQRAAAWPAHVVLESACRKSVL